MTQEEKRLLIKDLCARLPHKVIVNISASGPDTYDNYIPSINDSVLTEIDLNTEKCKFKEFYWDKYIVDVRPYLRPMSSMTEEEFEELKEYSGLKYDQLDLASFPNNHKCLDFYLSEVPAYVVILVYDWLNSHHFDYRSLIEKGLAIEVTEENNPYKK